MTDMVSEPRLASTVARMDDVSILVVTAVPTHESTPEAIAINSAAQAAPDSAMNIVDIALDPEPGLVLDIVDAASIAEPDLLVGTLTTAPSREPETTLLSNSGDQASAVAMLEAWLQAWEQRNVVGYLDFYSADFQPAYTDTVSEWQRQRERNIAAATESNIRYSDLELSENAATATAPPKFRLQFWLQYRSANYSDDSLKELILVATGTGWKIVSERNLETNIVL